MNILKIAISMSLFTCGSLLSSAYAANTQNLTNTSSLPSQCSIQKISDMNFGTIDFMTDTKKSTNGSIKVTCTKGTFSVYVGKGNYSTQNSVCTNQMYNTTKSKYLAYNLYYTSSYDTQYYHSSCGYEASIYKTLIFTEANKEQLLNIYGKTITTNVPVGVYQDSINIWFFF